MAQLGVAKAEVLCVLCGWCSTLATLAATLGYLCLGAVSPQGMLPVLCKPCAHPVHATLPLVSCATTFLLLLMWVSVVFFFISIFVFWFWFGLVGFLVFFLGGRWIFDSFF